MATASLLEVRIDEAERKTWFLFEASRKCIYRPERWSKSINIGYHDA
jgi:hypothetical protein